MRKVLITGSLGLVGSTAVEFFKEKKWEVFGVDNNNRSKTLGTNMQISTDGVTEGGDITDPHYVEALFVQEGPFDAVIHAAAQPSHDYSMEHPYDDFKTNVVGTLNMLEGTRKHSPNATFIYVSSDRVYGSNKPQGEELIERPTRFYSPVLLTEQASIDHAAHSPFGAGKVSSDIYVQEYGYQYGLKTACFRPGCITGKKHAGSELHGFMAYLTKCIKERKQYRIFGHKGKQVRDQIHAHDLVTAFYEVVKNPKVAAVYNMGGGPDRSVSVWEAAKAIVDTLNTTATEPFEFIYEYVETPRHSDMPYHVHDVSKFKRDYPEWNYKYNLQDIIKDLCTE